MLVTPEIIVALITLVGVIFTSIISFFGHKHAKAVNNAVNNRPKGEPTLYQLVVDNHKDVILLGERVENVEEDVSCLHRHITALECQQHRDAKKTSETIKNCKHA